MDEWHLFPHCFWRWEEVQLVCKVISKDRYYRKRCNLLQSHVWSSAIKWGSCAPCVVVRWASINIWVARWLIYWFVSQCIKWGLGDSLSRFQGFQVEMPASREVRGIDHACVCILFDFPVYLHACVWSCTHGVLYYRPQHPVLLPSSETPTPFLHQPYLSPSVHSCKKQRSAERDICSVRECPNYSWPFNHSGFGLCGICGASHKCATAILVNGTFIIAVVLHFVPPN